LKYGKRNISIKLLYFGDFANDSPRFRDSLAVEIDPLSIIRTDKIDLKVSRSTVDLDILDLANDSPKSRDSLPVEINLLAIIGAEKFDFKVRDCER